MNTLKSGLLTALSALAFSTFITSCNNSNSTDQATAEAYRDSLKAASERAMGDAGLEGEYYPYEVEPNGYSMAAENRGHAQKVKTSASGNGSAETLKSLPSGVTYNSPELHTSLTATIHDLRINRPPVFSTECLEEEHPLLCSNAMIEDFVKEHIVYPEDARENGDDGLEYVTFRVTKAGKIENIAVRAKEQPCEGCAIAAREVVSSMPANWAPALRNGKPVDVTITLPIRFETIQ